MPPRKQKPGTQLQPLCASEPEPDDSVKQQFEIELQWCVQQLEGALLTNKMNPRQAQDAARSLTVLKSKSAPMAKKRQVMRTSFGDYRAKMSEEEKKLTKAMNRTTIAASSPNTTSRFVKRSSAIIQEKTDNSFKFNFQVEPEEVPPPKKPERSDNKFIFHSSDNNFRFNFSQEPDSS